MNMKKVSLQWKFTMMTAAVVAAACIALTLMIGKSANTKMDEIGAIFVEGEEPAGESTVDMEDVQIVPEYYERLRKQKQDFYMQSIAAMTGIMLAGGLLMYFVAGKSLKQLNDFSGEIEKVQAQNLSEPLELEPLPKEIGRLCAAFNQMMERLEESFRSQKQFSANAAHELRTPLAVMRAKIDVFEKTPDHSREEYEEMLGMLNRQTERLSELVNELLEMTGLQTVERTDLVPIGELAEEVLCDLDKKAQEKNIALVQEPGNALTAGNETLIYRVIFNLVENAVKYNRAGGKVTVSAAEEDGKAVLSVTDTGMGIPKEYREQIFEPFFRVDKSRSREMGGAGIGLAMVKTIVELHGGTVYVKESSEAGSVIVCEFPSAPSPEQSRNLPGQEI